MEIVKTTNFYHREKECIGFFFEKDAKFQGKLQKLLCAKWSATHKCWYCEKNDRNLSKIKNDLNITVDENAKEKEINKIPPIELLKNTASLLTPKKASTENKQVWLSAENKNALTQYNQLLNLKGYSKSTQKTYVSEFTQFLNLLKQLAAADFSVVRLKDYFEYCYTTLGLSENSLHSKINALKFYYEQVLGRESFFWEIPRPKKHLILPKVLGEAELIRLFDAPTNLKHKAILFTAYSAGLRVSEVINLRMQDIDRERGQLFIYCSKGKKDRYVRLSPLLLDILESYYKKCNPRPKNYLFEGTKAGEPYSTRSAQTIFSDARKKAGISKQLSFHSLRHSFATHMLEKGVDVKYIKDILGHFDIKTTERYLHIKREFLINIDSPLDSLYRNKTKT